MATKKTSSGKTAAKVGAGVLAAAAVAGAAGYYFYGDKNAKKHRQAASKWAKGMKSTVVKEAKKLKRIDQKAMARLVDEASAMYQGVRSIDRKDLRAAANELKKNWEHVKAEVKSVTKRGASPAKRPAKKAPAKRKAPKKAAKRSR